MKISKTMIDAIEYARMHGGIIERHPGGFWGDGENGVSFGTQTIDALVIRGIAKYSKEKTNRQGVFPVEVALVEARDAKV